MSPKHVEQSSYFIAVFLKVYYSFVLATFVVIRKNYLTHFSLQPLKEEVVS